MKKFISILTVFSMLFIMCFALSGCGYEYKKLKLRREYTRKYAGTEITVYNWGEYISDGADGSVDVNREFERITGIKVNYLTFESNETMYSQVTNGGVKYDIIIPSDYMIERLISKNQLQKIDTSKLKNYDLISEDYKGLDFDKNNEYSVPYNVGMVGIIYNPKLVDIDEDEHSWNVLWDEKYKDKVLNFNNPRDAFMTAQMLLNIDINSENKKDWDKAAEKLKDGKENLQSYVMDEVYGKMETGEAAIAPYYAGDYLTMAENNPDLKFFYPKEGTNFFVDSICIPKKAKNVEAAMLYIDFLLEPDIAKANAEYIGYASPNTEVINNTDYCYYQNEILYPDEKVRAKAKAYRDIDDKIRIYYETLWVQVKLYQKDFPI